MACLAELYIFSYKKEKQKKKHYKTIVFYIVSILVLGTG